MAEQLFTKPITFTYSMWKFVGALYYIDKLDIEGELKERIFQGRAQDYERFLEDLSAAFSQVTSEFALRRIKRQLRDGMAKRWRSAGDEFFPILLNQGLVMSCTIFDSFLLDCFTLLVAPFGALCLSTQEDLDEELELEDAGLDADQVAKTTEAKIVKRFDSSSLKDKVKMMKKLHIDFDTATSSKLGIHEGLLARSAASASERLLSIYKSRNDIVHRGALPFKTYDDLHKAHLFFADLMLNIAIVTKKKYKIPTELDLIAKNPQLVDSLWGTTL